MGHPLRFRGRNGPGHTGSSPAPPNPRTTRERTGDPIIQLSEPTKGHHRPRRQLQALKYSTFGAGQQMHLFYRLRCPFG